MKKKAKISIILFIAVISITSLYILHAQFTTLFQQDTRSLEEKLKSISEKVNAIKDKTSKKASTILASAAAFLKTPEVIACKKFGACSSRAKWLIRSIEAALIVAGVAGVAWYWKGRRKEILPPERYLDVATAEQELATLNTNITNLEKAITLQNTEKIKKNVNDLMSSLWEFSSSFDISEGFEEILTISLLKEKMDTPEKITDIAPQIIDEAKKIVFWMGATIAEKKTKAEPEELEEYFETLE